MDLGIYLWEWDKISIGNKCRYKYKLDRSKIKLRVEDNKVVHIS